MSAATYTAEELIAMLVAGAEADGRPTQRAAVHLLTFTELPRWRSFQDSLVIEGSQAYVHIWSALPLSDAGSRLSSAGNRLLALAVSLAGGGPVGLRDNVTGLGHAHARRVVEAFLIATGGEEFYALTGTPALDELHQFNAAMDGDPR
jgi:hypothetical protein